MKKKGSSTKRKYELTTKQATKAKSLYGKGATTLTKLQAGLRKAKIPASRQSISNWMQAKKKGVRRPSAFWKSVRVVREETGISHKEATRVVYHAPKWGKKRHGKGYLTPEERHAAMKAKRAEFDYTGKLTGKDQKEIDEYGEEIGLGDTPK